MAITALGQVGSATNKAAGTTLAITASQTIPAGTLLVLCWTTDNAASTTAPTLSLTNSGGVAWTRQFTPAVGSGVTTTAGSGIWTQVWTVLTTSSISSGATITTVTTTSVVAKAAMKIGRAHV